MDCLSTIFVEHNDIVSEVPCGKCAYCVTNRRSDWMFRIHHEMRDSQYPGYFITLTYSQKKVPRLKDGQLTLKFRHVQLFFKKVRKAGYYAKYVCVGEYGEGTSRPHYHVLLWTDMSVQDIERIWSKGHIDVGELTMASAMYTLKYIITKGVWPKDERRQKPRAQFSRGVGASYLGKNFLEGIQVHDYHVPEFGRLNLISYIDGVKVRLPRYYRNKIVPREKMKEEVLLCKAEREQERAKEHARLRAKGIKDVEAYQFGLRTELAKRIVSSVKHNQYL